MNSPAFKRDRLLDDLNEKWGEQDERRTFFDLTHKPGEHGGLSLIPWFVHLRGQAKASGRSRDAG